MRGIRGAITVERDTEQEIFWAARRMVEEMCRQNGIAAEDIGAVILSATSDVTAAFPAAGVRQLPGFDAVPLFDAQQMGVQKSMPLCIRALMLADTPKTQKEIRHVYLGGAANLRRNCGLSDSESEFVGE